MNIVEAIPDVIYMHIRLRATRRSRARCSRASQPLAGTRDVRFTGRPRNELPQQ
jgi:hypothetical protein